MLGHILRKMEEQEARRNADKLPSPEEFADMSKMFKTASIAGGAHLSPAQCQQLSQTFATLSFAVIAVDQTGC